MEAGNKKQIALILRQYKSPGGGINFPAVFNIHSQERIPILAAQNFERITMIVIAAITMAMESMNLKRGLNALQILDLSENMIDSSHDDNLSLADILLFLQKVVNGEYEMSYESIDIPKFMRMFKEYREERTDAILEYRENQHVHHKALGDSSRTAKDDPLSEHFGQLGLRISEMKAALSERKQTETMQKADKFFEGK